MELKNFEAVVIAFFVHEINSNPQLYSIPMLHIPVLGAKEYVESHVERMRTRLAACIIRTFLKKQDWDGKVLLYKIIDHHLKQYLKDYTAQVLRDHYRDWYVITRLQEIRDEMVKGE